jgi:LacI family transcriptional regulator
VPQRFVANGEMHEDAAYRDAVRMLGEPQRPTAFLCSSTLQALGVMRAAGDRGLRIGRDVSVISHDDVLPHLLAENFSPPLTVTRMPIRDAGPILAEMMTARLAGTPGHRLQRTDPVELIVRGSTGPAPHEGAEPWQP